MSSKTKDVIKKDDVIQAILIADCFTDEFIPITANLPFSLLPVVNRPLIDYTLEFLSLGGIEETFLFCCTGVDEIKDYIKKQTSNSDVIWAQTMTVNVIVSESCTSLGDCMRDLDAKNLIRGSFVLVEPGVVSNVKLLPLLKKHTEIACKDKGAAMTIICQEAGLGQYNRCPREELILADNKNTSRLLFYKKAGLSEDRKIEFPLEIFIDNSPVEIRHNLRDTRIAICSPVVLPLFSDNFDFQTKDDFVRGLLMNEEILGCTVYWNLIKGSQHGGAVTNWRMYHAISQEIINNRMYPIQPPMKSIQSTGLNKVTLGKNCTLAKNVHLTNVVLGENIKLGENVSIKDSYIFNNVKIGENCKINRSIIADNTTLKQSITLNDCIIGENVTLTKDLNLNEKLLQEKIVDKSKKAVKICEKAYSIPFESEFSDNVMIDRIYRSCNKLSFDVDSLDEFDYDDERSESSDDDDNEGNHDIVDDTKLFFTEVFDSLARGFEDKLHCDNLILEINSSRYAYNITLKEVNYNVVKAILSCPFDGSTGLPYLQALQQFLVFFFPILKNYIKHESDMMDCLQAIGDVSSDNSELNKCVVKVLHWLYDKDFLSEDVIFKWYSTMDKEIKTYKEITPFVQWLKEAEEATSSDEE